MNLFTKLAPMVEAGLEFTFKVKKSPEGLQVDLLPHAGKDNKIGVALPARALVGTAAELDAGVGDFLDAFVATTMRVNEQIETATASLKAEEAEAEAARKTALENKSKTSSTTTRTPGKKPAKAPTLLGGEEDDEGSDGETTSAAAPAAAPAESPAAAPAASVEPADGGLGSLF